MLQSVILTNKIYTLGKVNVISKGSYILFTYNLGISLWFSYIRKIYPFLLCNLTNKIMHYLLPNASYFDKEFS